MIISALNEPTIVDYELLLRLDRSCQLLGLGLHRTGTIRQRRQALQNGRKNRQQRFKHRYHLFRKTGSQDWLSMNEPAGSVPALP